MLADLMYTLLPYQIFRSVFFRGAMGYLTAYFLVSFCMPKVLRWLSKSEFTSDLVPKGLAVTSTPIMGGLVLIPTIVISTLLWAGLNVYNLALMAVMVGFSSIGLVDDYAKVRNKKKMVANPSQLKKHLFKADGSSKTWRFLAEILLTALVLGVLLALGKLNGTVHVPMVPIKNWFPEIPIWLFYPFIILVVVGGANAVNLMDGLDSLATVPMITCLGFVAAVAYISGDAEWSQRLRLLFLTADFKEVSIFCVTVIATCIAFLKFNSPPALIYMGDTGSLGIGATIATLFVLTKVELYLPIVGGTFVLAALSTIIQVAWFRLVLIFKGREQAEKNRFFYKAPYHHHEQALWQKEPPQVSSVFTNVLKKFGLQRVNQQYESWFAVQNKVIWSNHIKAVWLLVIALVIFFKVR